MTDVGPSGLAVQYKFTLSFCVLQCTLTAHYQAGIEDETKMLAKLTASPCRITYSLMLADKVDQMTERDFRLGSSADIGGASPIVWALPRQADIRDLVRGIAAGG